MAATWDNPTGSGDTGQNQQIQQNFLAAAGGDPARAQQMWNAQHQQEAQSSGGGGAAPPYGVDSSQLLADAMAATNREQFEEKLRQFNETLAWEKQQFQQTIEWQKQQYGLSDAWAREQFALTQQQQDRQLWANMASQLNTTAASLHGQPRDWQKYAEYTQGGQDIFKTLWGNQPVAQFGAPTGTSNRITLADLLTDLGISQPPPVGTVGPTPPITPTTPPTTPGSFTQEQALDAIWANRPDLKAFYEKNGWKTGTPEEQRAVVRNWLGMTDDGEVTAASRDAIKFATSKGWLTATAPPAATAMQAPSPTPTPAPGVAPQQAQSPLVAALGLQAPGTYPGAPNYLGPPVPLTETPPPTPGAAPGTTPGAGNMAPLPYQMNPLVWDSLSDTAKQMILGSVEAGNTPSGVWTATDWLAQFNASRPKGTAPRSVQYNYGAPRSYF